MAGAGTPLSASGTGAGQRRRVAPAGHPELWQANSQVESAESPWHKGIVKRRAQVSGKARRPGPGWSRARLSGQECPARAVLAIAQSAQVRFVYRAWRFCLPPPWRDCGNSPHAQEHAAFLSHHSNMANLRAPLYNGPLVQ